MFKKRLCEVVSEPLRHDSETNYIVCKRFMNKRKGETNMRKNTVKLSTIGAFLISVIAIAGFLLAGKANGWFDKTTEEPATSEVTACVDYEVAELA